MAVGSETRNRSNVIMGHYSPDGQCLGVPSSNSPKEGWLPADVHRLQEGEHDNLVNIYPMLRVDEMLDALGKTRFITMLDLSKGYYQGF